jgi:hypothetical protein
MVVTRRASQFLLVVLLGCSDITGPSGNVQIRVANESSFAFQSVDVVFPHDSVDYGTIAAHSTSSYRGVSTAYRYALIIVQVAGEELRLQPIDYVGENELLDGHYTYALNLTIEGHLTLTFREDR